MSISPDELRRLLATADPSAVRERLAELYPADLAELLEELEEAERTRVFELLDAKTKAEVIHEAGVFEAADFFEATPTVAMASVIGQLPADDLVDILEDLPDAQAERLLELMDPAAARRARKMLAYPEETAGRLMSEKIVRVKLRMTVGETIEYLRGVDPETETFAHLYAVNARDQLVGYIRLRHLLTATPDTLLADLVEPQAISVKVTDDQEKVAQQMSKYDFSALPVVDGGGKLVGVITHDDILDVIEEEATEDIHRLGGSSPLDEPYLAAKVMTVATKRVGWLLMLLLTASLTMYVIALFQGVLTSTQMAALAVFIPLLIGTGGNAGSQTTSMVIRALAVGDIELRDAFWVLAKELRTGVLLGFVMAVGMGTLAFFQADARLAVIVALAACAIVVWATSVGSLLPLVAAWLRLDPTVVSGPMMSTLVDATGLFIYFSIARVVLTATP